MSDQSIESQLLSDAAKRKFSYFQIEVLVFACITMRLYIKYRAFQVGKLPLKRPEAQVYKAATRQRPNGGS